MAELAKKIYIYPTNSSAKLYTTINEVGSQYMMGNVDGVTCYASLGSDSDIRATNGKVLKNNKVYSILRTGKPPYTEKSWTTAGTYTFTVPAGVTRIRVAVCGGGGGASEWCSWASGGDSGVYCYNGEAGEASSFGNLITATGGTATYFESDHSSTDSVIAIKRPGKGGSPNGYDGTVKIDKTRYGKGFALSFVKTDGEYGRCINLYSVYANNGTYASSYGAISGSGGYKVDTFKVTPGYTYTITVGNGGISGRKTQPERSASGFVLIAFGGDI